MKWIIVLLAVGSSGVPSWEILPTEFTTLDACEAARVSGLKAMSLDAPAFTSAAVPLPAPVNSPLGRAFAAPKHGQTLSAPISGPACEVTGTNIASVRFYLNSVAFGNFEKAAPWNCALDPAAMTEGYNRLRAEITDAAGVVDNVEITLIKGAAPATSTPVQITGANARIHSGCVQVSAQ